MGVEDKAWRAEKEILRWAAVEHRHLGTGIDALFIGAHILIDDRFAFPADANVAMENLNRRGWAELKDGQLLFLSEGILMGEVIDDVDYGGRWKRWRKRRKYEFFYWLAWTTVFCGAYLVIVPAILSVCRLIRWLMLVIVAKH
ncbi:MAG: hypothetical protein KGN79_03465 [Acidobacteriota bacterium]|nr:hypothetical protein [Acidobacteriota bacterium]